MELLVKRNASAKGATIGALFVDGVQECFTLEDVVREPAGQENVFRTAPEHDAWVATWKIPNVTAMPRGRYRVIITFSPHFGCLLPLLVDVPGYTAVRIHWGNKAADTDGCLLVGQTTEGNLVYKSKAAFDVLFPKVQASIAAGEDVFLTVS